MLLNHTRALLLALMVSLMLPPAVGAQDRPSEFEGWVLPGLTFTPGVRLSGMWDSNVALAGQPESGSTADDMLLTLVPFASLDLNTSRTTATAGYRGYINRYQEIDALNTFDQRAYVYARHRLTPTVSIFGQNEFVESPTTDLTALNGLPFARVGSRSNRASGGIDARLSPYTDVRVRYDNTWASFDRLDDLLSDGTIHEIAGDVRRRLSARASVGAEGKLRRSETTSVEDFVIWFQDAGGLFDYQLAQFTTLSVAAGLARLEDSRFGVSRSDPYFRVELRRQHERASMGVAFERSYTPSFGLGGSNDNREVRGFIRMPFSRNRFYVDATGLWRRSAPVVAGQLELDTYIANTTVGYSTLRWLRFEGYHGYSRQDSVITGGEVNRHRLGVQVVVSQPMRIR